MDTITSMCFPIRQGSYIHLTPQSQYIEFINLSFLPNTNREEKSLRHVSMVAKFLDDNKTKKSLKSLFALFQTSSILFSFIQFDKSWRIEIIFYIKRLLVFKCCIAGKLSNINLAKTKYCNSHQQN